MTLRCELNINNGTRRVIIVGNDEETHEHLALRLAAAALFFGGDPVEPGPSAPLLADIGFQPDLLVPDGVGGIKVWIECGNVAMNKLTKVARRVKEGRLIVIKESRDAGLRQRELVNREIRNPEKVEIWAWPREEFARWNSSLKENNYIYGETSGRSLNLVLNESAFSVDLIPC
ncbi:MAG: YaeQ family protein [Elusimicrobia bacterium]|nr:YaeQ family protein [Elusimicrobiota bacterium]